MSEEFIQNEIIKQALGQISQLLLDEVMSVSTIRTFEAHTELVKEGQFVRVVPLVIKGLVKVLHMLPNGNYYCIISNLNNPVFCRFLLVFITRRAILQRLQTK
jgi:hypothetical protein